MHRAHNVAIRAAIGERCPGIGHEALEAMVRTAERYQGGERAVVIVACGVGDAHTARDEEGFLGQLVRWNVAVSRARCKVVQLVSRAVRDHLPGTVAGIAQQRYMRRVTGTALLPEERAITLPGPGGRGIEARMRWRAA